MTSSATAPYAILALSLLATGAATSCCSSPGKALAAGLVVSALLFLMTAAQARARAASERLTRELLKSQAEIREAEKKTFHAQKLACVGRLAAGVAHDFNNILTSVLGTAYMLRAGGALPEPVRPDLEVIIDESERAARLVRQLLDFARQTPTESRRVDLAALLEEAVRLMRPGLGAGVRVSVEAADGPLWVHGNAPGLRQVLLNLALNARDAMPRGGSLRFSLRRRSPGGGPAPFEGHGGEWAELAVSDEGCGMSEETLGRVFEPFFTSKGLAGGAGLGLSQAYGIVQQHQGRIRASSAPGKGSTFTIVLPLLPSREPSAESPARPERGPGGTLLLVDDDAAVRKLAGRILSERGYTVIEAGSAEEALETARDPRRPIDLLLTDVVMPGMNGRQLAARLEGQRAGLKVLYMSGYASGILETGDAAGAEASLLRKPFTPDELLARVRAAIARRP